MPPYGVHELLLKEREGSGAASSTSDSVDPSAQAALIRAVRDGDLERVRYLLSRRNISLLLRDEHDSTPLYYAALCGEFDICKLLLENGAKADEKTFDGERAYYAALNDRIRTLLRDEGFKRQVARGHYPFLASLEQLNVARQRDGAACMEEEEDIFSDVEVSLDGSGGGRPLSCHFFVLRARCPRLARYLGSRRKGIPVGMGDRYRVLCAVVSYLYTNRLEIDRKLATLAVDMLSSLRLRDLAAAVTEARDGGDGSTSSIVIEPDAQVTRARMVGAFSPFALYSESRSPQLSQSHIEEGFDVILSSGGAHFAFHKALLCVRGEPTFQFFQKLFADDPLKNTFNMADVAPVSLHILAQWLYSDEIPEDLDLPSLLDALMFADYIQFPVLKQCVASEIARSHCDGENCVALLHVARLSDCETLQDEALAHIAESLEDEKIYGDPLLGELILESANEVENREAVDTIELVDELRWHIQNELADAKAEGEAQERAEAKHALLEDILRELKLQA